MESSVSLYLGLFMILLLACPLARSLSPLRTCCDNFLHTLRVIIGSSYLNTVDLVLHLHLALQMFTGDS